MFTPRSITEVESDLRALVSARTPITDFTEGSVASSLIRAIAHQVASAERSIYRVREGFFVGLATGSELDERVSELAPSSLRRIVATPASGAVMRITRSGTSGSLVIPAGSVFATRVGVQYRTVNAATISNGTSYVDSVYVVATTAGSSTNAVAGAITTVITAPDGVIACENTAPLTNGADQESDAELQARAMAYLQSLSRSQPSALNFLARSFIASSGERMRFVSVFEDVEQPGYSEVIVDDGTGITVDTVSRAGQVISGVIPTGGYTMLYHESPATAPITPSNIRILRDGAEITLSVSDVVSIPERGIIYLKETAPVLAGDTWEISNYRVYTGYIAELQAEVEGDTLNASVLSGFRAAGTRVVVCPPEREIIRFDVALSVLVGVNYDTVEQALRATLTNYISSIAPGQPIYTSAMISVARSVYGVQDVAFYGRSTNVPLANIYPDSHRSALRTDSSSIAIVQTPAN